MLHSNYSKYISLIGSILMAKHILSSDKPRTAMQEYMGNQLVEQEILTLARYYRMQSEEDRRELLQKLR